MIIDFVHSKETIYLFHNDVRLKNDYNYFVSNHTLSVH